MTLLQLVGDYGFSIHFVSYGRTTVEAIVARTPPELLRKIYKIPEYNSPLEFLTLAALTNGRLLKVRTWEFLLI